MSVGMILVGEKTVRAATVNYTLENVNLSAGAELTGMLTYDTGAMKITGDDITLTVRGEMVTFNQVIYATQESLNTDSTVYNGSEQFLLLTLESPLTGGNETDLVTQAIATINGSYANTYYGTSGDVVPTNPVTTTPAPEPGTILGSVAALAMGVVIRGKKKLSSALEKTRSAPV